MSSIEEVNNLHIPLQELSDATNGFSERNLIAKGGFGKVYKGVSIKLGNVAIKMLDPRLGQGDHEFKTEIALLSVYKHEHIVSLLGFCDEDGKKILVYKFESNGSLDKHLSSTDLTWIQRLQICLDAARGLQYLHDDVEPQVKIFHRDVKSSNILLDENWRAKISDFGLSRIAPANTELDFLISRPCGTFGYADPEYTSIGHLTQKSDVYSFGVVLFEVLCGRLTRLMEYGKHDERQFLTVCVQNHYKRKTLDRIIHSGLQTQMKTTSLLTFSTIAYQCLKSGNERPTMKKVAQQLEKALDNQLAPIDLWMDDNHGFAAHPQEQLAGSFQNTHPVPSISYLKALAKAVLAYLNYMLQQVGLRWSLGFSFPSIPSASSSSQSWMCDVYISFNRLVTRKLFVDHLYKGLVSRQVITYMSHVEPNEKRYIAPPFKVIQESRIAIIVFGELYSGSARCLDELVFIMKNMDERGQTVIPIFYRSKSSLMRSKSWLYDRHVVRPQLNNTTTNNNTNKIESWREALERAVELSGRWDKIHIDQWESEKEMADRISNEIVSLMQRSESSAHTDLIGIDARMEEFKSLLEVGTSGVHKVGITGMWGSGKSTLASSIYDEISPEFEGSCFVKNVRGRSRLHGLKTLQEEILSNVLKVKVALTDIEQGINMMETSLRRNSVLIVLDDVDHIEHLEMLVGSRSWFGDGSLIIVTTRNQGLVNAQGFLRHNVRMLDVKEAIELFSRRAFGESKPAQGFEEVSLNLVSKFGGHPSGLISLGSFLNGKDMSVWMSILKRLVGIPVDEILKKFETPDDGLSTNVLLSFLLDGAGAV